MEPLDFVAGTADPAFVTDTQGNVTLWNAGAERVLGYKAAHVLAKPCYAVLRGLDMFDNCFCRKNCAIRLMARRRTPVHRFWLAVAAASGTRVSAMVSIMVLHGEDEVSPSVIHILQPCTEEDETNRRGDGAASQPSSGNSGTKRLASLTGRERQLIGLLAAGWGSRQIASALFISLPTVRNHVRNILRKLEVHSKLEAVVLYNRSVPFPAFTLPTVRDEEHDQRYFEATKTLSPTHTPNK